MAIVELYNEFLIAGVCIYLLALIFVLITFILTHTGHLLSGAVVALVAGTIGQISSIVFKIGIVLTLVKIVLNFI